MYLKALLNKIHLILYLITFFSLLSSLANSKIFFKIRKKILHFLQLSLYLLLYYQKYSNDQVLNRLFFITSVLIFFGNH